MRESGEKKKRIALLIAHIVGSEFIKEMEAPEGSHNSGE
jgi:hypothetical protein